MQIVMAGVNKVILVGFLGLDPEIRTLENGTKLARIRMATSETYTAKDGQRVEQTEWHNVVLWRQLADITERYLGKGKQVYIEGKLKTRSWKDQEGNDRYTTEVVADSMQLLGKASDQNDSGSSTDYNETTGKSMAKASASQAVNEEDDLPF
jgi:single-strand DNA-binding protein